MKPRVTGRRAAMLAWRVGLFSWLTLTVWPVTYGVTRLAQCVLLGALWIGALALWWGISGIRWSLLIVSVLGAVLAWAPGRSTNAATLRHRYVAELRGYKGVRYIWGGENALGIDCSGLPRRALIHALWKEGAQTLNPTRVRQAASIWWHDASAAALGTEYLGQTKRVAVATSVPNIESSRLQPGDLAVTSGGGHVLAYLGGYDWIEADPGQRRVVILRCSEVARDPSSWLNVPVTVVRWRLLAQP